MNAASSQLTAHYITKVGVLALTHPLAALVVTAVLVALMAVFAAAIVRAVRRRFGAQRRVAVAHPP